MLGNSPAFREAADRVGRAIARRKYGLVYGGGRAGLMGVIADAALGGGAEVIGVIPEALAAHEVAHRGISDLRIVPGMHERKAMMSQESDAFLTLPGGIGTYEEFFEILTWAALGIHHKPIGLLNVEGYFDPLLALLEFGADSGLIRRRNLVPLVVSTDPEALVADILSHTPPAAPPRIALDES